MTSTYCVSEAIRTMFDHTGLTHASVSRGLGRRPGYIDGLLCDGGDMHAMTFVRVANACGYQLVLKGPHDDEIEVVA